MAISDRLKRERIKKGYSQLKLGEILNVTQQAVAKWEKGISEPDSENLLKIAQLYGISTDYLLGNVITDEERAAGAAFTKKISISPIEEDMLYAFRQVGARRGEAAQRAIIDMVEKML